MKIHTVLTVYEFNFISEATRRFNQFDMT